MRALEPEVVNAVWEAVKHLIPQPVDNHPLGCHRPRVPDRLCFWGILIRLILGCSWQAVERLLDYAVSDTTLRNRRDEWIKAGVFKQLEAEALRAYDRMIGLDLTEVSIDGSAHKAPCGGPGTGKNPTDRAKSGWKWSLAVDRNGIPVASAAGAANRHDTVLLAPTLQAIRDRGLIPDIETLHLDRGYDSPKTRGLCRSYGITDIVCARKRPPGAARPKKLPAPLGMRWTVERTNSWLSNYGQLRRNTDRRPQHRQAQLRLAIALIIIIKLINWRNRWNPKPAPIR